MYADFHAQRLEYQIDSVYEVCQTFCAINTHLGISKLCDVGSNDAPSDERIRTS